MAGRASGPRRSRGRDELLVAFGTVVAQASAYALNVLASRMLGTERFGALAALLTLTVVIGIPATALAQLSARTTADHARAPSGAGPPQGEIVANAALASATTTVLGALVALAAAPAMRLPAVPAAIAVAATVFPSAWLQACLGTFQGSEQFRRLTLTLLLAGVAPLTGAVALATGVHEPTTVVTLMGVAAMVAALAAALLAGFARGLHPRHARPLAIIRIAAVSGAIWVLSNIDVVIARANLSARGAGVYAAGALIARAVMWAPQFVTMASFARFTDPRRTRAALRAAAVKTGGVGLLAVATLAAFGAWLVPAVLGPDFHLTGRLAWLFACLGSLMALNQLLLAQRVARHDEVSALAVWAAALVFVGLASALPGASSVRILHVALGTNAVLGLALCARASAKA